MRAKQEAVTESSSLAAIVRLHQARQAGVPHTVGANSEGFAVLRALGADPLIESLADQFMRGDSNVHALLDALQAVFWALQTADDRIESEKIRLTVFNFALYTLHAQNGPREAVAPILAMLLKELHYLQVADLPGVINEVVRGIVHCEQNRLNIETAVAFSSIELLPQLLLRVEQSPVMKWSNEGCSYEQFDDDRCSGEEFKNRVVANLLGLLWPDRFFLQILKTFREFEFTSEQENALCSKIFQEAHRALKNRPGSQRDGNKVAVLPTIFYHVLLLVTKMRSAFCKRLLTNMILRECGQLTKRHSGQQQQQRESVVPSIAELNSVQSTMIYHLELVLKQDPSLANIFMAEYELHLRALTPFDISLLLTIAGHTAYEPKVTNFLIQLLVQSYTSGGSTATTEYLQEDGTSYRSIFLDTIALVRDAGWGPLTQQLVHLGFRLMIFRGARTDDIGLYRSSRSRSKIHLSSESPWIDFGTRLVLSCFQHHISARESIIDRIVNTVIVQGEGTRPGLKLLTRIIKRHPTDIDGSLATRIQECIEYVTHLTPHNAGVLFRALSPVLKIRPHMKDFLILTMRKAMFRKDENSRMIAIKGFAFLLCLSSMIFSRGNTLTQLYSQNIGLVLSQGVQTQNEGGSQVATQEQANALIAEDLFRQFCGIFRRAMQLQASVRLVLYAELMKVFQECPALRPSILELIFQHYLKYYDDNETILPPVKIDSCLPRKRGLYEEPFGYLLHAVLFCVHESRNEIAIATNDDDIFTDDEILATQTPAALAYLQQIEDNVSVLMERMKRCELSDFEFDKSLSFAAESTMGLTNRRLGKILLGLLEVCMNSTIQSWSLEGWDDSTLAPLVHFFHMYQWIITKVGEVKQQEKSTDGKKRGRPPGKGKTKHAQTDDQVLGPTNEQVADESAIFAEHSLLVNAHLMMPASIVSFLKCTLKKLMSVSITMTRDEEDLLGFMLTKTAVLVDDVERNCINSFDSSHQKSILAGGEKDLVNRLGPLLFGIFHAFYDSDLSIAVQSTSSKSSTSTNQVRKLRSEALQIFEHVVQLWAVGSADECADYIVESFRESAILQDNPIDTDESPTLESCILVFQNMFDGMMSKRLVEDASLILRIMAAIWGKMSPQEVATYEPWMRRAIVQRNFSSQKVLADMIQLFLRPHRESGFQGEFAGQLARGVLYYCNSGSGAEDENTHNRLQLDKFDDKCIITVATSVLSACDDAMSELEVTVKVYDAEQRRQAVKLKDGDLNMLHILEDETDGLVLDITASTTISQTRFKQHCRSIFDMAGVLQPFVMMDLNILAVSSRVIRLIGRLYKLLVILVNCKVRLKDSMFPKYLGRLFDRTAGELSPALLHYISCLHDEAKRIVLESVSKGIATKRNSNVQSKLIPDVIFQMEQYDLALIKLSKLCKERDFSPWCRLRQSRDFRFDTGRVKKKIHQDDNDEDEETVKKPTEDDRSENGELNDEEIAEEVAVDAMDSDHEETQSADEDPETQIGEEDELPNDVKRPRIS